MPTVLNSIVAGATKNITMPVNPLGDLQSGYVSGQLPTNGEPFYIYGSGFGAKIGYTDHINTSGIYDLPVDSNFNVVGRWDGRNYEGVSNRPVIKAEGISGNKCLYFSQAAGGSPNNCLAVTYDEPLALGTKVFSSRWVQHSSSSVTGGQWKFDRYQKVTNSVSDKPSETYHNANSLTPDNKIQVRDFSWVGGADGLFSDDDITKFPHNKNTWMRMDTLVELPVSYADKLSYKHQVWVYYDPAQPPMFYNFTADNTIKQYSPYGQLGDEWVQHLYQNYFGNGDFGSSTHSLWMDKVYESVGDDKRVEYTNNAVWGSHTRSFVQPLAFWSDNRIDILSFDKGDLSSGWIHVIENGVSIYSEAA